MHKIAWKLYQALESLLVPKFCCYCRKLLTSQSIFCCVCDQSIKRVATKELRITSTVTVPVFAVSLYEVPLKELIVAKGTSNLWAAYALGNLITTKIPLDNLQVDYCIPVPLHWTRYAWRGYNQAKVMAREVARIKKCVVIDPLKRIRRTSFQSSLQIGNRQANVKGAFGIRNNFTGHALENKHLILIDDLMTTGATLQACARELLTFKPASIKILVACRI